MVGTGTTARIAAPRTRRSWHLAASQWRSHLPRTPRAVLAQSLRGSTTQRHVNQHARSKHQVETSNKRVSTPPGVLNPPAKDTLLRRRPARAPAALPALAKLDKMYISMMERGDGGPVTCSRPVRLLRRRRRGIGGGAVVGGGSSCLGAPAGQRHIN